MMFDLSDIRTALEQLYEAAKSHPVGKSRHMGVNGLTVYMRVGRRSLRGCVAFGLTIATVDATPQRQGRFKALLSLCDEFAREHGMDMVYVESVGNEHLRNYLVRNGFIPRYEGIDLGNDFYRPIGAST